MSITGVKITTASGMNVTSFTSGALGGTAANIVSGASVILNESKVSTTSPGLAAQCSSAGSRYSATISITYTEVTGLGSQTLTATGTVAGTAAS